MELYSKKNFQVKHGKYGSIMPPIRFPWEAVIIRSYPLWQEDSSLTSWNPENVSAQYLVYKGF